MSQPFLNHTFLNEEEREIFEEDLAEDLGEQGPGEECDHNWEVVKFLSRPGADTLECTECGATHTVFRS